MSFKVLFPGNKRVLAVDAQKLDPEDNIIGSFQGLVSYTNPDGGDVSGILLSDPNGYSCEVMDVLCVDFRCMKIQVLSSKTGDGTSLEHQFCVKISIDNDENKIVEMFFDVTKTSLEKYEQLCVSSGVSWFILKGPGLVFLAKFNVENGSVRSKELQLLH